MMKTRNPHLDLRYKGRPFWKVPRDMIINEDYEHGSWRHFSKAAQAIFPVLQIFSREQMSDMIYEAMESFGGVSKDTVCKGIRDLENSSRIMQCKVTKSSGINSYKTHSKKIIAGPRDNEKYSYGIFPRSIVLDRTWANLSRPAQACYISLLPGLQVSRLENCCKALESGDSSFPPLKTIDITKCRNAKGRLDWQLFMKQVSTNEQIREIALRLPCVSFRKTDDSLIGSSTLATYTKLTPKSVRKGLTEMHNKGLLLRLPRKATGLYAQRIFLPPYPNS